MNVAYDERERRGIIHVYLLTVGFTLAALVLSIVGLSLFGVFATDFSDAHPVLASLITWPLVFVLFGASLEVIYRYAPCREKARWKWVTPGSIVATVLWGLASAGFAFYASRLGNYQETYGALGGVILLLMWLWITALTVVLGAEVNSEIEAQTALDSTTGPPEPMGKRGARKADTLGNIA